MKRSLPKTLKKVISERSNDYTFLEKKYAQATGEFLLNPFVIPRHASSISPLTVSIIIASYNARESILACLTSIEQSSFNFNYQNRLQVVVVDDGSTDDTWDIIKKSRFSMHFTAVRQNNHGQAKALNTGISVAEGNIIISCDADMVLSYYTIDQFVVRHQQMPNVLLAGFRSDIQKTDLRVNAHYIHQQGSHRNSYFTKDERIIFPVPGQPNNMCLASDHYKRLGYARGLWMPGDKTCKDPWLLSDLVIGALFSLSREVFLNVGGYDERLHGWGSTDGILAAKAISNNQFVIPVYAASGLHISHPFRTKNKQKEYAQNRKKFFEILKTEKINCHPNWIVRAKDRIIESFVRSPMQISFKSHKKNLSSEKNEFSWNEVDSLLAVGEYVQASISLSKYLIADNNSEKLLRLGKILLGLNRYQEVINVFKEVSIFMESEPKVIIEIAIAYASMGRFMEAHQAIKKLSEIHPQVPELFYWHQHSAEKHIAQGRKYLDQEFHDIALRCFEAALIAKPNSRIALRYRDLCIDKLR